MQPLQDAALGDNHSAPYWAAHGYKGFVAEISHQVMTSSVPDDRYTRGFLTGKPRVFSLFMALTYAMTSPTWPL